VVVIKGVGLKQNRFEFDQGLTAEIVGGRWGIYEIEMS
jgi:hypothetical protein